MLRPITLRGKEQGNIMGEVSADIVNAVLTVQSVFFLRFEQRHFDAGVERIRIMGIVAGKLNAG